MKNLGVLVNLGISAGYVFYAIFKHDVFYMAYSIFFLQVAHFVWDFGKERE